MNAAGALQKLLTWLSPAFPVGAFAWSAGLEAAIAEAAVTDSASLRNWLAGGLSHGAMRTDAVLLAHAHRAANVPPAGGQTPPPEAQSGLAELADLCLALTPALERHAETITTGAAFVVAARAWPDDLQARLPDPCPYPIAVGAIAAAHGIGLDDTLVAYLTAALHAQVSVAVRLVPLGQTEGLRVMAALEPLVAAQAAAAAAASLAELGTIAYAADIAQMRHETLETRLFRS